MANVKRLAITGIIPYNCDSHPDMLKVLGHLNAPSIGVRITYDNQTISEPIGKHGGIMTLYPFTIKGEEAMSDRYIDHILQAIVDCGGTLHRIGVTDIEENETIPFKKPTRNPANATPES